MGYPGRELETRVAHLKRVIAEHDGRNVADAPFVAEVDALLGLFYDDIGEIKNITLRSLFDLFLIRCLYVERGSRDAAVLDYLGAMLVRFLWARELPLAGGKGYLELLEKLVEEGQATAFQNLFEAYRKLGDNHLFITGLFPRSVGRWGGGRRRHLTLPALNLTHYTRQGVTYYRLASEHELAEATGQKPVLFKLATYFDIYRDALQEVGQTYITGFDYRLVADKMLDNWNRYRRTGDPRYLENARKYAALLHVERFPRRRPL